MMDIGMDGCYGICPGQHLESGRNERTKKSSFAQHFSDIVYGCQQLLVAVSTSQTKINNEGKEAERKLLHGCCGSHT